MNLEVDVFLPVLNYRGQFEFTNGFFSDTWQFKGHGPFEIVFRKCITTGRPEHRPHPQPALTISSSASR